MSGIIPPLPAAQCYTTELSRLLPNTEMTLSSSLLLLEVETANAILKKRKSLGTDSFPSELI
jgi:hypothetical protein